MRHLGLALALTVAAAAAPRPAGCTVVAFGDSLTAGYGVAPEESYPSDLGRALAAARIPCQVENQGISGDTSTDALERLPDVLALHPSVVILELGGNDGLRGLPVGVTRANLQRIIAALRTSGARILLVGMSLPPNYGADYIASFEHIYRELAAADRLPLVPFIYQDLVPQLPAHRELLQADGIHASAAGNRIVAATVLRYLKPLLPAAKS